MSKPILRKYKGYKRLFIICLYLIAIIVAWILSTDYINEHLKFQMLTYLDDLARQKAAGIDNKLVSNLGLLESIADQLARSEKYNFSISIEEVATIKEWVGIDKLAIIDANGCAYTSEGDIEDVSDELIYKIPMEGVPYISGVLEGSENEDDVTLYGVPIISTEGEKEPIAGVIVAEMKTEDFVKAYRTKFIQEQGFTYLIDKQGNVIEGTLQSDELEMDNIFDQLRENEENKDAIKKLEKALSSLEKVSFHYENNNEKEYAVCIPLKSSNWYMIMVIPEHRMDQQIHFTSNSFHALFSTVFALSISLMIYNVISEKKAHTHLENIAYINRNTGLPNKNYLREQLCQKILQAKKKNAVLVIYNIQRFKVFNELYGTDLGDKILNEVANVLKHSTNSKSEIVIHGYADEFATLYFYESKKELEKRIQGNLNKAKAVVYNKHKIIIDFAVGIYVIEDNSSSFESIYTLTCMAKNKNKESVTELFTYYTKDLVEVELDRKKLEDSIREGINNKEFKAWFQPQVDSVTNQMIGCESLARWHKSDGTVLTPYYFIEASERSALICDIDMLIFEDVCKNIKEWIEKGLHCVPVSVNISRSHLQNTQITGEIKEIADKYNVPTELIQIEITESIMIENEKTLKQVIDDLHEMGFKVLLDDFGVGYSSLMAINSLNFDVLKIDKSFVDAFDTENGKFIIDYTIHLGRQLGMDIIVEGVETKEQVDYFGDMERVALQGFYFSKPVDCIAIQNFLQHNS